MSLHYLYMAAFGWMCAEGLHLYFKVVEVFSETPKIRYYYLIGWGKEYLFRNPLYQTAL